MTVEDQGRDRPVRAPGAPQQIKVDVRLARPIEAGVWHGQRLGDIALQRRIDQPRRIVEKVAGVLDAAAQQIVQQPLARRQVQGGQGLGVRIARIVGQEGGEGDLPLSAGAGQLLQAVGPVAASTEQPHADKPRLGDDALGEDVDRQGMLQLQQISQADGGRAVAKVRRRAHQTAQIAVGGGQDDDIARRLAEVHRLVTFDDRPGPER